MSDPVDLSSEAFKADPYPSYAALRQECPAHRVAGAMGSEVWLLTRYDDAREALADPRFAKDPAFAPEWAKVMAGVGDDEGPMGRNMLNSDPPDHTRQRKLVNKAFTPRRVAMLAPRIQQITDGLIDAMAAGDEADLMEAFAHPLPMTVICELLGVPTADRHSFAEWTRMLLASPATEEGVRSRRDGNQEMSRYLTVLIDRLRPEVDPSLDNDDQPDLLSALINPGAAGDRLDHRELLGMVKLLLVAGHETTVNHIGNGMLALLRRPELLRRLQAEPELLEGAVEELLRFDGPIERVPMRFTTEDVEIGGTVIPRGSAVNVVLGSANRDSERFPDADVVDLERTDCQHLAFGFGVHYCVGAPLARLESRIAFGTLLRRCPDIGLAAEPEELRWRIGGPNIMRGLDRLPVRLGAVRAAAVSAL